MNAWPMNEAVIDYVKGKPSSGIINDESISISIEEIISTVRLIIVADSKEKARICQPMMYTIIMPNNQQQEEQQQQQH